MCTNSGWGPDALEVIQTEYLSIPILGRHPLWLAVTGEVLIRRAQEGLRTDVADFSSLQLYDSETRSHAERIARFARSAGQDPLSRFRRVIRRVPNRHLISWVVLSENSGHPAGRMPSVEALERSRLNVASESMSLTNSRYGASLISPGFVRHMYDTWERVYSQYREHLIKEKPSAVLLFNGRFVKEGAARAAALDEDLAVYGFDQGVAPNSVAIFRNHVHDYDSIARSVEHTWFSSPNSQPIVTSTRWFEERIYRPRQAASAVSVTLEEEENYFGRTDKRKKVVVFTTSSDEMTSIDAGEGTSPDDQFQWIQRLLRMAAEDEELNLHIRVHPNASSKNEKDVDEWRVLAKAIPENVVFHQPDSPVNSYALCRQADVVLTFGSTISAEAAFLRRPVLELSESHLSRLGICTPVRTEEQLRKVWDRLEEIPLERRKMQALKYANWLSSSGDPLQYASLDGVNASLMNYSLEPFGIPFRLARRGYNWLEGNWVGMPLRSRHGLDGIASAR